MPSENAKSCTNVTIDSSAVQNPKPAEDRRKHARFRICIPVTIRASGGSTLSAVSLEISQSGMSAMATGPLGTGETVEVEGVVQGPITAVVRHNNGKLYGFEFVKISASQILEIVNRCKMLPPFGHNALGI